MDRQPQPLAACACKFMDREQWTSELAAGHRLCEAHFRLSEHSVKAALQLASPGEVRDETFCAPTRTKAPDFAQKTRKARRKAAFAQGRR